MQRQTKLLAFALPLCYATLLRTVLLWQGLYGIGKGARIVIQKLCQ